MSLPLCPCDAPWTDEYRESHPYRLDPEHDNDPEDDTLLEGDSPAWAGIRTLFANKPNQNRTG